MTILRRRFSDDLRAAEKAEEPCRAATLRLILAALENRDGAARDAGREGGIGDEAIREMLARMVAQRRESIVTYRRGGRADLAAREAEEIGHIQRYLPRQLDDSETDRAVSEAIAETDAGSLRDTGRTMAALKRRYAGRMDFAAASQMVRSRLAGGA